MIVSEAWLVTAEAEESDTNVPLAFAASTSVLPSARFALPSACVQYRNMLGYQAGNVHSHLPVYARQPGELLRQLQVRHSLCSTV